MLALQGSRKSIHDFIDSACRVSVFQYLTIIVFFIKVDRHKSITSRFFHYICICINPPEGLLGITLLTFCPSGGLSQENKPQNTKPNLIIKRECIIRKRLYRRDIYFWNTHE